MPALRSGAIARHVDAAKALLRDLEQQAEAAMSALGRDQIAAFFAAVDDRTRTLEQLDDVVDALVQERNLARGQSAEADAASRALIVEVARAAASALESHERLTSEARRERNRLAQAHERVGRPDGVAHRYAASASQAPRSRTFSVSG